MEQFKPYRYVGFVGEEDRYDASHGQQGARISGKAWHRPGVDVLEAASGVQLCKHHRNPESRHGRKSEEEVLKERPLDSGVVSRVYP